MLQEVSKVQEANALRALLLKNGRISVHIILITSLVISENGRFLYLYDGLCSCGGSILNVLVLHADDVWAL